MSLSVNDCKLFLPSLNKVTTTTTKHINLALILCSHAMLVTTQSRTEMQDANTMFGSERDS